MNKKLIIIVLVVSAVAVAGCVGGGGQAPDTGDGGDGDGTGNETDGRTDDGGGDSGGSGGSGDGTTGETSDGGGDGSETGNGTGGSTDGTGTTTLGNAFSMTEEFAFEVKPRGEQQSTVSGRFHQGDMYMQFESERGEGEFYMVGGDQYTVMSIRGENRCIKSPDSTRPAEGRVDIGDYKSKVSKYSDITPTGTTTIDGKRVRVYKLTPQMTGRSDTMTYYVGVDSGYLRRVESPESVVNFHSWNDVEPVKAPDMNCQDSPMSPSGSGGSMPGGY